MKKTHKASIYMKLGKIFSFKPSFPHLYDDKNVLHTPFQILQNVIPSCYSES